MKLSYRTLTENMTFNAPTQKRVDILLNKYTRSAIKGVLHNEVFAALVIEYQAKPGYVYLAYLAGRLRNTKQSYLYKTSELLGAAEKIAEQYKPKKQAKSHPHTLDIGDILSASWGYEQTNVNYYQITEKTAHTVTVREIASERTHDEYMSGRCIPLKNNFISDEEVKRKVKHGGIKVNSSVWASLKTPNDDGSYSSDHFSSCH